MLADHRGQLEAVEIGHAYIDQNERDLVLQQIFERLARRGGLEQGFPNFGKHNLVAQKLGLLIVDKENIHPVVGFDHVVHRCSHIRSADSNCSVEGFFISKGQLRIQAPARRTSRNLRETSASTAAYQTDQA